MSQRDCRAEYYQGVKSCQEQHIHDPIVRYYALQSVIINLTRCEKGQHKKKQTTPPLTPLTS